MVELPNELPDEPEELKKLIMLIASERNDFFERLSVLEQRYKEEMRAKYGRKAETYDPSQLLLFAQAEAETAESPEPEPSTQDAGEAAEAAVAGKSVKAKGHGRRKPQLLPRKPVILDVSEQEKICQRCNGNRDCFGRAISLRLDYIPGTAFYWEYIRLKYACRACEGSLITAPVPEQPIDRGMPAAGMLAYIATSKYADHLPLYRLEGILSRQGLVLNRSTMSDWVQATTKILLPIFEYMMQEVKRSKVIWTDDTPVRVLDRMLKKRTRTGRIWVYRGDSEHPYIIYRFTTSRERAGPRDHLENFRGFMHADAFTGYDCIFVGGGVTEVACFAHARRKFVTALDSSRSAAAQILLIIQELYNVERDHKESTADDRLKARQERSIPLLQELKDTLDRQSLMCLPQSPLAKAINYTRNQWDALNCFTTCGDLTIDNNLAENALRPIAIGRKNWMFAGSESGGQAIAVISSIVATCRRLEVDPFAYLKKVLEILSQDPTTEPSQLVPNALKSSL